MKCGRDSKRETEKESGQTKREKFKVSVHKKERRKEIGDIKEETQNETERERDGKIKGECRCRDCKKEIQNERQLD